MEVKKELVSIIVPVYNAEKYLERCIEHILKQTYSNFELLLIDDGSRDSSLAICERIATMDSRIRVLSKENGGASTARNLGLDNARGEYIMFQDSDDYMLEHALQTLYDYIVKEDADMCVGSIAISENFREPYNYTLPIEQDIYITDERDYWKYCFINYGAMVPWAKLYKKAIWDGNRFVEGKIHEDEQILQCILPKCKKIVMLKNIIIVQNAISNSVMNQGFREKNLSKSEFMIGRFYYFYSKKYTEYYLTTFGEGTRVLLEAQKKLDCKQNEQLCSVIKSLYKQYKGIANLIIKEKISFANKCRLWLFKLNLSIYGMVRAILR